MLRSRLSRLAPAVAVAVLVSACAGADGTERGAIRENVIEPGITAIAQASEFACNSDAATLRTALEAYELLVGAPAPDESVLVGEFLREESDLWDVVDGQLVPADPGCGSVPTDAPDAAEIVTSTEPPQSADEMFSGFTTDQIAAVGGEACARQLAAIFSGADRYAVRGRLQPGRPATTGRRGVPRRVARTLGDHGRPADTGRRLGLPQSQLTTHRSSAGHDRPTGIRGPSWRPSDARPNRKRPTCPPPPAPLHGSLRSPPSQSG